MLGGIELTCLETIFAVKLTLSDGYAVTEEGIGGAAGDFPNYFSDFYSLGSCDVCGGDDDFSVEPVEQNETE